jgi:hypothetical protein
MGQTRGRVGLLTRQTGFEAGRDMAETAEARAGTGLGFLQLERWASSHYRHRTHSRVGQSQGEDLV